MNPPEKVEVGDYGRVNKETGSFEREGSIYDATFMPELRISELYPPVDCPPEDKIIIVSKGGSAVEAGAEADACVKSALRRDLPRIDEQRIIVLHRSAGVAGASIGGHWKFRRGRGAVLVMVKPTYTTIPKDTLRPKLQLLDVLAEKALVSGVWSCPTYALILTDGSGAEAGFTWSASNAAGVARAGTFGKWATHSTSGVWRCGGEDVESTFFPLLCLETPKTRKFMDIWKRYRTTPVPTPEGDYTFRLYPTPWGHLNQEGDEVPLVDDISSDEDE